MGTDMLGLWDRWYQRLSEPAPYGDTISYQLGAEWLIDCDLVEDWGCGKGWMRTLIPPDRYRGVDGSNTPFADVTADLRTYQSQVPGVFIRHVLEHNTDWALILANAIRSAQHRLVVILFTPLSGVTHETAFAEDPGVPDISFRLSDLTTPIAEADFSYRTETFPSLTQYGTETIIYAERA